MDLLCLWRVVRAKPFLRSYTSLAYTLIFGVFSFYWAQTVTWEI